MTWISVLPVLICVLSKTVSEFVESAKFKTGLLFPETSTVGLLLYLLTLKAEVFIYHLDLRNIMHFHQKVIIGADHFADRKSRSDPISDVYSTLVTRKRVYALIEDKLEMFGISGKECLLRTICEATSIPLAEHNGVIGDILQIMLMPTSTQNDDLDPEYYAAETNGHQHKCQIYYEDCPISLLDIFSKEFN